MSLSWLFPAVAFWNIILVWLGNSLTLMNVCEYNKVNTNLIDSIIKAKYADDAKMKHGAPILYYLL